MQFNNFPPGVVAAVATATAAYITQQSSGANGRTYTFSGVTIPSAGASYRKLLVMTTGANSGGGTFTGCTIGGVAASEVFKNNYSEGLSAHYALDNTNISGSVSVVITMSDSGGTRCGIGVFSVEGNQPLSVYASAIHTATGALSQSVSYLRGMAVVAFATSFSNAANGIAYGGGLVEQYDTLIGGESQRQAGAVIAGSTTTSGSATAVTTYTGYSNSAIYAYKAGA
tara:strand:+ start:1716 stop:2396 length:681 start_codon:yes stop_codon:yes gene_type:complete